MQQYRKNLGKVSLTTEGAWDRNKFYEILSIVYEEHTQHGFISRKAVPVGVDINNKEYWMPFNVSGYADNNTIILNQKESETTIKSYTLEEAIKSIASVGRKPGAILGFYNENTDRLDIGGRWELWQYNGVDVADWENVNSWDSIYYNYNKFVGWYRSEESLKKYIPFPEIGCYAYIGSDLNEAVIYRCDRKYVWTNTTEHVWDYIKVIVGGNVTVGENGNWFNNGVDTNIPASIKGENGKTPIIRNNNNILEVSYDNVNWTKISDEMAAWFRINNNKLEMSRHEAGGWEVMSDYIAAWFRWQSQGGQQAFSTGKIQITRDGVTWTDLSGEFVNNLRISRYIGTSESLPTSGIAEGTIYAKGPYYEDGDTLHEYPAYRLWVYAWKGNTLAWVDNGQFTSIAAGIVQETGDSEVAVMSQKAVTEKLSELGSEVHDIKGYTYNKIYTIVAGKPNTINIPTGFLNGSTFSISVNNNEGITTNFLLLLNNGDENFYQEYKPQNKEHTITISENCFIVTIFFASAVFTADTDVEINISLPSEINKINNEIVDLKSNVESIGIYGKDKEFVRVFLDDEGKILFGINKKGDVYFGNIIPYQIKEQYTPLQDIRNDNNKTIAASVLWDTYGYRIKDNEFCKAVLDADGKLIYGVNRDGELYGDTLKTNLLKFKDAVELLFSQNKEYSQLTLDKDNKIIKGGKNRLPVTYSISDQIPLNLSGQRLFNCDDTLNFHVGVGGPFFNHDTTNLYLGLGCSAFRMWYHTINELKENIQYAMQYYEKESLKEMCLFHTTSPYYEKDGVYYNPASDPAIYDKWEKRLEDMVKSFNGKTEILDDSFTDRTFEIKYWQGFNEIDLAESRGKNADGTYGLLTIEDCLKLMRPFYEIVKRNNPNAVVLCPAFSFVSQGFGSEGFYDKFFNYKYYDYDESGNVVKEHRIWEYFDAFDFHFYKKAEEALYRLSNIKNELIKYYKEPLATKLINMPMVISETGDSNASNLLKKILIELSLGISKISVWTFFWSGANMSLIDYSNQTNEYIISDRYKAVKYLLSLLPNNSYRPIITKSDNIYFVSWKDSNNIPFIAMWADSDIPINVELDCYGACIYTDKLGNLLPFNKIVSLDKEIIICKDIYCSTFKILSIYE